MVSITIALIILFFCIFFTGIFAVGDGEYQRVDLAKALQLPQPYQSFLFVFLWAGLAFLCFTMLVYCERIYASFRLRAYEKQSHTFNVVTTVIVIIFATYILAKSIVLQWISLYTTALLLAMAIFLYVGLVSALYRAHIWNIQRFYRSQIHVKTYTLSQRFQLSENVRTVRLILESAAFATLGGAMTVGQLVAPILFPSLAVKLVPIMNVTGPLTLSSLFLPAAIMQICKVPAWKRTASSLLQSSVGVAGLNKVMDSITNNKHEMVKVYVLKRKQTEGKTEEQEIYFEMFNNAWQ
ncbi:unnamed protein product [Bursaphelenchus okinawaensis]|uniref:Uncharacterized protein n=1 Tax=Bursaphelenchus okinawaensis TaxID=465554 RepID=A0A811KCE6_9BILA|nr:unnamed protein product [Bursaphelenchus okinawaensis]CAG9098858.1 unnamed protein product [Bursaphelenchus okinawaensis]